MQAGILPQLMETADEPLPGNGLEAEPMALFLYRALVVAAG
jgi:hypothetical protein